MGGKHFVIIGAGAGGLATALRLAHRGYQVTVLEKNGYIGGRNRRKTVNGCEFDGGPTLLMMLDPFRRLFQEVGECLEDSVPIQRCDPSYRVFFSDGKRIDATPRLDAMTERIRTLAGTADADAYAPFLTELKALYDESIPNFVRKNYRSLGDFARPAQLKRVVQHHMLGNLAKRVEKRFESPYLHKLFCFQTMYLGLSPYDAPWVYATLAYMEYGEGIWYPKGGLPAITEAIADLAVQRGATIRLNCPVAKIEGKTVTLESGETIQADAVIANADLPYVERELSQKPRRREFRFSCSSHLLYINYEGELPELEHHNVFFGPDFEGNLDALFHDLRVPHDPAFYACIASKTDASRAPKGHHSLFLLIPVPNLDCPMSAEEIETLEHQVFDRLARESSFDPSSIRAVERCGPQEWQSELNLDRGAAFGISHDLFQSAFMRPGVRSKTNPDLYYVGASTVPGNGLPMVLISAELVEEQLLHDGVLA